MLVGGDGMEGGGFAGVLPEPAPAADGGFKGRLPDPSRDVPDSAGAGVPDRPFGAAAPALGSSAFAAGALGVVGDGVNGAIAPDVISEFVFASEQATPTARYAKA